MLCFVTVGTTQFDEMVSAVLCDETLTVLHDALNIDKLYMQFGTGQLPDGFIEEDGTGNEERWTSSRYGIQIRLVRFSQIFNKMMSKASIIIGHAGAGTCLEVLNLGKPFVVVINEGLADNHQVELAERLALDGHVLYTTPSKLIEALQKPKLFQLKRYQKADPQVFANFLNKFVSIV